MAKVYFDKGFKPEDLEDGVEFEVDHEGRQNSDSSEDEDESFYDERFEHFKGEIGVKSKDLLVPFKELKEQMTPVTEDSGVMKQLIKWGVGVIIPDKSVVIVHYDAFLENQKNPFDSTRLRNRPYKFLLGDGAIIPGLDFAMKTMKKEEISKFLVSSEYGYGKMGCPPRIPGNAQILYVVEILNFYDSKDAVDFEEMAPEDQKKASFEKITSVFHCENQMGNELFRNEHYKPAIARYRRMVKLLEDVSVSNGEEDEKRKEYLLKLYLNLSACYLNIRNSSKAFIYADLALKTDGNNPKALYRMGYALFIADDFDRARYYLNRAKQYKPYEKNINKVLMDVEKKHKQHREWENMFYKKMFSLDIVKEKTVVPEPSSVREFRNVLEQEFKKFIESEQKELRISPGYTDEQVEIVKDLAREHNLAFVSKIQNDTKVIKVAKKP